MWVRCSPLNVGEIGEAIEVLSREDLDFLDVEVDVRLRESEWEAERRVRV